MTVDLERASSFMAMQARVLDRLRYELLVGTGDCEATLCAVDAYRNPDGGYGRGLEPDLRSTESQPAGALHAFEVLEEVQPAGTRQAAALCDWLSTVSDSDGGIPFALPVQNAAGCAPFWASADTTSSLHMTAAVAGAAHRVATYEAAIAGHAWLARSTRFCMDAIAQMEEPGHALELLFSIRFLDAVHDTEPRAPDELRRLGEFLPSDGGLHVAGGLEDEMVRPLDFAPRAGPASRLWLEAVISRELDRLDALQKDDGGWPCDFALYSPAAALEWRGYLTVAALTTIHNHRNL